MSSLSSSNTRRKPRAMAAGRTLQLAFAAAASASSSSSSANAFTAQTSHTALTPSTTSHRIRTPPRVCGHDVSAARAPCSTSTTALGVASFRKTPSSDTASDDDAAIEANLLQQADELEEMLQRTSFSAQEQQQQQYGIAAGTFDPFEIETNGDITILSTPEDVEGLEAAFAIESAETETTQSQGLMGFLPEGVWAARLLVVVAAALYGTNFSVVKILDETMPVGISSTLRFAMAAAATLPWLLAPSSAAKEQPDGPSAFDGIASSEVSSSISQGGISGWLDDVQSNTAFGAGLAGFEVGLWNSIGYIAQAVGLETTAAGKSAFICSLAVVIVPILDRFAGKKFLPRELVGAAMAVAGVGMLEFGGGEGFHTLSSGDTASLIQPLAFGMGFWRSEHAMHKYPDEASRATAGQMLAVFVASSVFCLVSASGILGGGGEALPPIEQIQAWLSDPSILGALLWTGIVTTALTVYMETLALKTLSAAETTMIFSTEPLWGAAFAAAVLGERFGPEAGAGAGLILAGIACSNLGLDWLNKGGDDEGMTREHRADDDDEATTPNGGSESLPSSTTTAKALTSAVP